MKTLLQRSNRARARGFTLLEMMIAICILAIALSWLIEAITQAVEAENHAKLVTTATFLARQQMVELEDELQEKGMTDDAFASEKAGDFEDAGFKRFKWKRLVDKIQLPGTDVLQTALGGLGGPPGGAGGSSSSSTPPASSMLGGGGSASMITSQFGIIKDVLEQGIRRATITIAWTEHGKEQSVVVSQYLTDPRKVDQSIQLPGGMPGGLPGMGGGAGGAQGGGAGGGTTNGPGGGPRF